MCSDWTSSLGNGEPIGTGRGAEEGSPDVTPVLDTFQDPSGRHEEGPSDKGTHLGDGTGYAGTNEDIISRKELEHGHSSRQDKGLANAKYDHDAEHKSGDVASVELMGNVGYASGPALASPMGAAITSLMRIPAGETKPPTLSATASAEEIAVSKSGGGAEDVRPDKDIQALLIEQRKLKDRENQTKESYRYAHDFNLLAYLSLITSECFDQISKKRHLLVSHHSISAVSMSKTS